MADFFLVLGAGQLFEIYYHLACNKKSRNAIQNNFNTNTPVNEEKKASIIKKYGMPFAFYIATMALLRSRGRNNQAMFYISLLDEYHGLSNRGRDTRAAYNTCLSRSAYSKRKREALNSYKVHVDLALQKGLAVGVADNYNKQYYLSKVSATQQGVQNENRCVAAISVVPHSLEIKRGNMDLDSLPPPEILRQFVIMAMSGVKAALKVQRTAGSPPNSWKYYENAEVTSNNVYCVPLKMPAHVIQERGLPLHDIGLTHFRPLFIHQSNPASNKGCFELIHDLYDAFYPMFIKNHYIPFRFDIGIYDKFLRVFSHFSCFSFSYCLFLCPDNKREKGRHSAKSNSRRKAS